MLTLNVNTGQCVDHSGRADVLTGGRKDRTNPAHGHLSWAQED